MNTDIEFAQGLDGEVDPLYAGYDNTPPAERQQREDALPRGTYFVELQAGKASFGKEPDPILGKPIPRARLGAVVLEGPEGTVGRVGFGAIAVYPSGLTYEKDDSGKRIPRKSTQAEYDERMHGKGKKAGHIAVLRRVAEVLGLVYGLPSRPHTEETVTEWAKQFAGKRVVLDVSYMPGNDDFDASNLFIWGSVASPDEQVKNEKGEVLGTALEVARKKIEKANKRAEAKAGTRRSAEQFGALGGI